MPTYEYCVTAAKKAAKESGIEIAIVKHPDEFTGEDTYGYCPTHSVRGLFGPPAVATVVGTVSPSGIVQEIYLKHGKEKPMSFEEKTFKLKAHVFNAKTRTCKYCGTSAEDDAIANSPCDDAPKSAPDFAYDVGEVMAYYNFSDEEWLSLSNDVQNKLAYRTYH